MATVVTIPIQSADDLLRGTTASEGFVASTQGLEAGHLAMPVWRVGVAEGYESEPTIGWPARTSSAQKLIAPMMDYRDQVRFHQYAISGIRRRAAESAADALEQRHAHRSTMRAVGRDPLFAQLASLGEITSSVALGRLASRSHRPLWLFVLQSITGARLAQGSQGLDDAVQEWRTWGRQHGLIP